MCTWRDKSLMVFIAPIVRRRWRQGRDVSHTEGEVDRPRCERNKKMGYRQQGSNTGRVPRQTHLAQLLGDYDYLPYKHNTAIDHTSNILAGGEIVPRYDGMSHDEIDDDMRWRGGVSAQKLKKKWNKICQLERGVPRCKVLCVSI